MPLDACVLPFPLAALQVGQRSVGKDHQAQACLTSLTYQPRMQILTRMEQLPGAEQKEETFVQLFFFFF